MKYLYQDPAQSVETRVEDLLGQMTLEEKFAQLRLLSIPRDKACQVPFDCSFLEQNRHRLGAIYNSCSMPAENIRSIQDWCRNNTRLGIPFAFHGEAVHGVMHSRTTVFPQAIGLGATFNPSLLERIAAQIGREARAIGLTMVYAPNVDLSRDPRWGRVEENYGEDPYLTSRLGVAYVKALQAQGVAACPKHYIAHGSPEGGINLAPVHAGIREFRETLMVPFQKVIQDADPMGIMPAYSELDGEPVHSSHRLLTELLREEFGFRGQVVSDYGAIQMLHTFQRVAQNQKEAGILALKAGVDMEAPNVFGFGAELEEAVRSGEVSQELVDQAVRRVLRHKFALGLFEDPYAHPEQFEACSNKEALALARQAARESVVLLKNEGGLLPLDPGIRKLALIGPNADCPQLGDYTCRESLSHAVTLRAALEQRLGKDRLLFAPGCTIAGGTQEQLAQAVSAAAQADAVILVLGDNSNFYGGIGWGDADENGRIAVTCGEGFDNHSLELPGKQQALLEAVAAVGKPVILVMESGRPYAVRWAKEHIPAILQAWYPGEQGGYALAEILFGEADPSGRLPISFPRSAGHIPAFYNCKPSARGFYKKPGSSDAPGRDYVFDSPNALFSFGDGLSYTTFAYSDLAAVQNGIEVTVTVTVENTGSRAGYEVAQLYVTDRFCRVTPFVRQLRGFEKLYLEPGQKQTVCFRLGFEDFAFVNEDLQPEVEAGEFILRVGGLQTSVFLPGRKAAIQ